MKFNDLTNTTNSANSKQKLTREQMNFFIDKLKNKKINKNTMEKSVK